jgi:hypothetical protein
MSWTTEDCPLLPCPFCGGKAEFVQEGSFYSFKVQCTRCEATTGGSAFRNDVYNASVWNRRYNQ